jgi:hypothetical protein
MYRAGSYQKRLWDENLNSSDSWAGFCGELRCNCLFWGSILKFHLGCDPFLERRKLSANKLPRKIHRNHPTSLSRSWVHETKRQTRKSSAKMSESVPISISWSLKTVILLGCWPGSGGAASLRTWVNQLFDFKHFLEVEGYCRCLWWGSLNNLHSKYLLWFQAI